MTRREFLQIVGLTFVASQLPIADVVMYPNFDPCKKYGNYVQLDDKDFDDKRIVNEARELLDKQIEETIPPRFRQRIAWKVYMPERPSKIDPYANQGFIAWKYTPA